MKKSLFAAITAIAFFGSGVFAQTQPATTPTTGLQPGDLVAICGDSITEQKQYSENIETYLLACDSTPNLHTFQFGWGGETSWGFLARMQNDVIRYAPTVATTCYGMNDGGYGALTDLIAKHYTDTQTQVVEAFKKAGVRFIVLGSPGCVDSDTFHGHNVAGALVYNKTLTSLRDIDKDLAAKEGVGFADVNTVMNDVMAKAKAKYGHDYVFAGPDGVHPGPNGHICMTYAFLKALGCTGDIGTITIDLAAGKATASDGHEVLSFANGTAKIRSSRYPYCFDSTDKTPTAATTVLPFLPFQDDLNRFKLVVTGAPAGAGAKCNVKFGDASKTFDAADLANGINLAAEFPDNPFSKPFAKLRDAVAAQQNFETPMIKGFISQRGAIVGPIPENGPLFDAIAKNEEAKRESLSQAASAALTPVEYEISVTPAN